MNHTERIAETARQNRHLTRRLVKEAVETYLELLAEDVASGEWVDLHGIGKMQVVKKKGSGTLWVIDQEGKRAPINVKQRLRAKLRLFEAFKKQCYRED
jgi:nucleoid DNA-binding protein